MKIFTRILLITLFGFAVVGCGGSDSEDTAEVLEEVDSSDDSGSDGSGDVGDGSGEDTDSMLMAVDTSLFEDNALVSLETVDCTLSNGEASECYSITIAGFPTDRETLGDFCPDDISADAQSVGKWFDSGELYDLTGEFVSNLDLFYGDSFWQLYDETTGDVRITDTQEACEAAARPNVDEQYYNHCVVCEVSYFAESGNKGVESTYLIPVNPVLRDTPSQIGNNDVGIALNGVNLAPAAPTAAILSAYTVAAFDDCVGHVNPVVGYHYHGANHGDGDCPAISFEVDGHGGIFAYALDGIAIYSMLDETGEEEADLDECRGHTDEIRGYHYHTAGAGDNEFIGCFAGETAQ